MRGTTANSPEWIPQSSAQKPDALAPAPASHRLSDRTARFSRTARAATHAGSPRGIRSLSASGQSSSRISSFAPSIPSSTRFRGRRSIHRSSFRSRGPIAIRPTRKFRSSDMRNRMARLNFSPSGEMRENRMDCSRRSVFTVDIITRAMSYIAEMRRTFSWFSCASRLAFSRVVACSIMFASWEHTVCIRWTASMSNCAPGVAE